MRKSRSWSPVVCKRAALALLLLSALAAAAGIRPRAAAAAAAIADAEPAELYQSVLDLQNPWTVMCVAAHPDDEDGATLTVLRRKYGAHTVTLFSTFGEGGQNAVGPELYEELGAIRARETEEASRIQGSEAYFLGMRDFGFSKSADEALRVWGHDETLRRMVLKIRELRPDVIITNHDTTSGHGHHQATGRLVLEAFDAAADPRRFPEQIKGVGTWQVQRLFVRFQFEGSGSKVAEEEAQRAGLVVSINPNERDEVRGKTYAELALQALQRHATQGPWPQTVPAGGRPVIRYRLARTAAGAQPLPTGATSVLDGMSLPDDLTVLTQAKTILQSVSAGDRRGLFKALASANLRALFGSARIKDARRFILLNERSQRALALASGVTATLSAQDEVLVPGETTDFTLTIRNGGEAPALINGMKLEGLLRPVNIPKTLAPGESVNLKLKHQTPRSAQLTVPHSEHLYDGRLWGEALAARVNLEVDGAPFTVEAATRVDVAPAVEIVSVTPSPLVLTPSTLNLHPLSVRGTPVPQVTKDFNVRLVNHRSRPFEGSIFVDGIPGYLPGPGLGVALPARGAAEVKVPRFSEYQVRKPAPTDAPGPLSIPDSITLKVAEAKSKNPLSQRTVRLAWVDAAVAPGLRVGYVRSFDDTLRDSLAALGVEAKELSVEDVKAGDLQKYQAIIIDNRGYQAHPELVAANQRLMDYVREGGTLIVFYHRTNEWNPDPQRNRPQLAPYPITLGNSRVTDETAAIEFAEAAHPLLNYPNKITAEDFAGWIQERGLYYPQSWDAHYAAPLSAHDPGEPILRGGLLAADYGRGRYVYTSMVWYRQLRAGIPGAYRVLANMISYGRR